MHQMKTVLFVTDIGYFSFSVFRCHDQKYKRNPLLINCLCGLYCVILINLWRHTIHNRAKSETNLIYDSHNGNRFYLRSVYELHFFQLHCILPIENRCQCNHDLPFRTQLYHQSFYKNVYRQTVFYS